MASSRNKINVLDGSIKTHLIKMVIPSIGGMFSMIIFNITDTFFVSKLGTNALAAMGFTFPIVMIIGAISSGISMGSGSILARAMGKGDHHKMSRIATDGILLSILAVVIISILGLLSMTELFTLLGANSDVLPLVKDYMLIWYLGVVVVVMPPVSDSCMRAMGDMIRPSLVMIMCAGINVILDPIFIFGYFGITAMGIKGAALATVISRIFGMVLTLSFLHFHHHLVDFKYKSIKELFESWKEILGIGVAGALVRLLPQVVRLMLTKLAAVTAGVAGVAALAAGSRIEGFATVISMAVGVSIVPIMGQNYGAKRYERVEETRNLIIKIAFIYGIISVGVALVASKMVARIFTDDSEVVVLIAIYLIVVLIGSIGLNIYNWLSESFTAIGKPRWAIKVNVLGTFLVIIPCVLIGSYVTGYVGMVVGLTVGQTVVGYYAYIIGKKVLNRDGGVGL